jgi:hypothetical protein
MTALMVTWTDIFEGIGTFSYWVFGGMRSLGHLPNVIISIMIVSLLGYWTMKIMKQNKEADRNGTYK